MVWSTALDLPAPRLAAELQPLDPATRSVLVNSEDGFLYRWSLDTSTFSERIRLTNGLGEA